MISLCTQLCRSGWWDRFMTSLCQVFAQTVRSIQLWTAQAAWAGGDAACPVHSEVSYFYLYLYAKQNAFFQTLTVVLR